MLKEVKLYTKFPWCVVIHEREIIYKNFCKIKIHFFKNSSIFYYIYCIYHYISRLNK